MYIPSQFEAWFLNNALKPEDIDKACEAIIRLFKTIER